MATIKWLTSAACDLDRIVEYFRQESPRYRIVYDFNSETDLVEILSIFHSSRQFGGNEGTLEP